MGTIFNSRLENRKYFKNSLDSFFSKFLNFKNKIKDKIESEEDYRKYKHKNGLDNFAKKLIEDYDFFSNWLENEFLWIINPNFQEFRYDIIYINWFIKENKEKLFEHYYWYEIESYKQRSFFLYLYSLLDKITTVNYWVKKSNDSEFVKQITSTDEKQMKKTLNLVRGINFNKIEYNIHLKEFNNSTLWATINLKRNMDSHWPAIHQTEDPNDIHIIKQDYSYFIYLTLFLFLWYLKKYALLKNMWGIE